MDVRGGGREDPCEGVKEATAHASMDLGEEYRVGTALSTLLTTAGRQRVGAD